MGTVKYLRFLLIKGADAKAKWKGQMAFHLAFDKRHKPHKCKKMVLLLLPKISKWDKDAVEPALEIAALNGQESAALELFSRGFPFSSTGAKSNALHHAVRNDLTNLLPTLFLAGDSDFRQPHSYTNRGN